MGLLSLALPTLWEAATGELRVDLASYGAMEMPSSGALEDVDWVPTDTRELWVRLLFPSEY